MLSLMKQIATSHLALEYTKQNNQYLWWNWPVPEELHQTTATPADPSGGSARSTPLLRRLQVDLPQNTNTEMFIS